MTPERAQELLNIKSKIMPEFKLIEVGNIRGSMTSNEVAEVTNVWHELAGDASFYTALNKIAKG